MRKALGPARAAPDNEEERIVNASLATYGSTPGVLLLRNVVKTIPNPYGPGHLTFGLGEGSPDVVGSAPSQCPNCGHVRAVPIGLEFKTPTGHVEPHQARLHNAWRGLGWEIDVPRSPDDVGAFLARLQGAR